MDDEIPLRYFYAYQKPFTKGGKSMSLNFESYSQKGHEFINHVADELKIHDKGKAGRITRCVLRALRNRLSMEESFQLIAQLPMAIKAVYVDGWKVNATPLRMRYLDDFIDEMLKEDGAAAWHDFFSEKEMKLAIEAVFKTVARYVSPGEIEHVLAVLPHELKILLTEAVAS